ncbi:hypothetical protein SLEP1_g6182 [Rubroshorea leprosula]|uniref:Xyloglucan endotransglucosylase/hydrolase n=1 Tax=Rubroshorea leprosula TaxID=152421 RepID=A0AAV5I081_9ROSI|nr:hypothetical protein SLEP1_g6182 [Rubroshorea leprosula]
MAASGFSSQFLLSLILCSLVSASADFFQDVVPTWGGPHVQILNGGRLLTLTMDQKNGGAGFSSKVDFLFGRFDMQMKLIPGNSAGTVTTFYLTSGDEPNHDEIDFEFLGNTSGSPYTVHTNVFINGQGGREEEFKLWFDPSANFHSYSIVWGPQAIMFFVDNIPIRVYGNQQGTPYPHTRRMKVLASLWNGEGWATRGGKVKLDWAKAPFITYYRNYLATDAWQIQRLDPKGRILLKWAQKNYRTYYYCHDFERFSHYGGRPQECRRPRARKGKAIGKQH